jgi:hypothetical protein
MLMTPSERIEKQIKDIKERSEKVKVEVGILFAEKHTPRDYI